MIQKATPKNIADAGFVYANSWQVSHRNTVSREFLALHTPEHQTETLQKAIKEKGDEVFISYQNNKPIGILSINRKHNEIVSIYILSEYWRQGFGKELLLFALNELKKSKEVFLIVLNSNIRARNFYERMGFAFSGEEKVLSAEKGLSEMKYIYKG